MASSGLLLLVALLGCGSEAPVVPEAAAPAPTPAPTLVLVTLDTTRADALGCYGADPSPTPTLDGLAASGLRVHEALASVPLTLPSHSSMFTGQAPDQHGVRDNIGHRLPDSASTVVELLDAAGWQTVGVVASAVLDGGLGLDQGFDAYVDGFDMNTSLAGPAVPHRRGEEVVALAAERVAALRADQPAFVWVHLFDPHHPLQAPEPFRSQHADPYTAEVAYADAQVAALQAVMAEHREGPTTWLVVGDHGEGQGEHGEESHGQLVFRSTVRVPFVLAGPGIAPSVLPGPVSVADVAPTLAALAGVAMPSSPDSASVLAAPDPARIVYTESFYPRYQFGMSELRAGQDARWHYIEAPTPRLYDHLADPGELTSVAAAHPAEVARLQAWLDGRVAASSARVEDQDAEVSAALAALGYVVGPPAVDDSVLGSALADPMEQPDMVKRFETVMVQARLRPPLEGAALLEHFLQSWPAVTAARQLLSRAYQAAGEHQRALDAMAPLLLQRPTDVSLLVRVSELTAAGGDVDTAMAQLSALAEQHPDHAGVAALLGELQRRSMRCDLALSTLRAALERHPHSSRLRLVRGACLLEQSDLRGAEADLRAVLEADPANEDAPWLLGRTLAAGGQSTEAAVLFEQQVARTPDRAQAHAALGAVRYELGDYERAMSSLSLAVGDPTIGGETWILLADCVLRVEGDPERALELIGHAELVAGGDPRIHEVRSAALMAQGDVAGAVEEMSRVTRQGTPEAP